MLDQILLYSHDWSLFLSYFLSNPINLFVLTLSWYLALSSLFLLKYFKETWKKTLVIHSHLFFLLLPLGFSMLTWQCGMTFSQCAPMTLISLVLGLILTSFIMGFFVTPMIYNYLNRSRKIENTELNKFVEGKSKDLDIKKPSLFYLDTVTPQAYSYTGFQPVVYLSLGLLEALNKKELEAVILHEMGHIKNRSHLFRFSTLFSRAISPLVSFVAKGILAEEEKIADATAIRIQKTSKYINSARRKITELEGKLCN